MSGLRLSCHQVCPGILSSSLLNSSLSSDAALFARSITTREAHGGAILQGLLRSTPGPAVSVFQARACLSVSLQLTAQIRMAHLSLQAWRMLV